MVKKLYPLCENHLFSRAYRKGKSDVNRYTAVYVIKNYAKSKNGTFITKLGITVNKKLGKAVKRSRVKRIIRAAYRANLPLIKPGFIVIVAAKGAAFDSKVKSTQIEQAMKKSLIRLGVIDDKSGNIK